MHAAGSRAGGTTTASCQRQGWAATWAIALIAGAVIAFMGWPGQGGAGSNDAQSHRAGVYVSTKGKIRTRLSSPAGFTGA